MIGRLLFALAATFPLLMVIEITLALLFIYQSGNGTVHEAARRYYAGHERALIQLLPGCSVYDSLTTYHLRPGSCEFDNREFRTTVHVNSGTFRGAEADLGAPQVVVLGDSYAMGWGVPDDSTFPALLSAGTGLKVLNTATASWGTARELIALARVDLTAAPVIIIQYCDNDASENAQFVSSRGHLVIRAEASYDSLVAAQKTTLRYFPGKYLRYFLPSLRDAFAQHEPQRRSDEDIARQAANFLATLELSPVPLERFPVVVTALGPPPNGLDRFLVELRRQAQESQHPEWVHRIRVVNTMDSVTAAQRYRFDDHIRSDGYARVAAQLARELGPLRAGGHSSR